MKSSFLSAVCTSIIAILFATGASGQSITILGGGVKGGAYQMAVGLSKLLKEKTGMNVTPQSTKGMKAQSRILDKGNAQFAFGIGGAIGSWAYNGQRGFKEEGAKKQLRAVLAYPFGNLQWLTLADSGINNIADLKGKKVSVGGGSSLTATFARILLPAHGINKGDYNESTPGFSGGFGQLRDRAVDAHITVGKTPISGVRELVALKKIRLIDMDPGVLKKLVDDIGAGVGMDQIPAGAYGANQVNKGAVNTLSMFFGFTTSTHVSADVVYKVTKALFENLDAYKTATPKAKAVSAKGACVGLAFPLHEGAKRYYQEKGMTACK